MVSLKILSFPRELPERWMSDMLLRWPSLAASVSVFPMSREGSVSTLERLSLNISSELLFMAESGRPAGELQSLLEEIQPLLDDIRSGSTMLFRASVVLSLLGESRAEAEEAAGEFCAELRSYGVSFSRMRYRQHECLREFSLRASPSFGNSPAVTTESLPALLPFTQTAMMHPGGTFLGLNALDGTPVVFDRFHGLNYNAAVVGKSGSGKSYFVKTLLLRESAAGTGRFFVIDPLGEFFSAGLEGGGSVVDVAREGIGVGLMDVEHFLRISAGVGGVVNAGSSLQPEDYSSLVHSLTRLSSSQPGIVLNDALASIAGNCTDTARESARLLAESAPLSWLMNGRPPDLDSGRLVVFDLSGLPRPLIGSTIALLALTVFDLCRHQQGRKTIVVDEAWSAGRDRSAASILSQVSRHSRHYATSLMLISQNFEDFLSDEYGEVLINNSSSFFVFRHERLGGRMGEMLEMGAEDEGFLSSSTPRITGTGRCVLVSSGRKIPLLLISSPSESALCSSEQSACTSAREMNARAAARSLNEAALLLGAGEQA